MAHRRSERFKGPRKTYSIQNCPGYGQGDIGDEEEPGAAPSARRAGTAVQTFVRSDRAVEFEIAAGDGAVQRLRSRH